MGYIIKMCIICTSSWEELSLLEEIDCSGCGTLKVIPLIHSLRYLSCFNCPLLKTIPSFPLLRILYCYNCPSLGIISHMQHITDIDCSNCPLLVSIPNYTFLPHQGIYFPDHKYINKTGCRWLNDLTLVNRVVICQKYIKSSHRGRLLSRALKTKSFVEWIYSPEVGGKYIKRRLLDELEK
jgi:hypothetical protein